MRQLLTPSDLPLDARVLLDRTAIDAVLTHLAAEIQAIAWPRDVELTASERPKPWLCGIQRGGVALARELAEVERLLRRAIGIQLTPKARSERTGVRLRRQAGTERTSVHLCSTQSQRRRSSIPCLLVHNSTANRLGAISHLRAIILSILT